jgi:hypothetical protein
VCAAQDSVEEESNEEAMVEMARAVVDPWAVMVHLHHTSVALSAMM